MLRLSIDEREAEDAESILEGMPIVINEDLLDQYGDIFSVTLDEHGIFDIKAGD